MLLKEDLTIWDIVLGQVKAAGGAFFRESLIPGILNLIKEERDGAVTHPHIARLAHLLLAVDMYKEFEKIFLEQTALFYQLDAAKKIGQIPVSISLTTHSLLTTSNMSRNS